MAASKKYTNESITTLKGADRVRKRPGVIFGSDGLEGCEHAVFEILSNSIDEARGGYGDRIIVTRRLDLSVEVEDFDRGCPVDWNPKENRFNWELVYCELYAGGKYDADASSYEFSLGLNGLGSCATQYSSRYMDVTVWRDGFKYTLHFERGEIVGELQKEPYKGRRTGTLTRCCPTWTCSPISISRTPTTPTCSNGRRWSTVMSPLSTGGRPNRESTRRPSTATKTASPTMWPSLPGRTPSPRPMSAPASGPAETGKTSPSTG